MSGDTCCSSVPANTAIGIISSAGGIPALIDLLPLLEKERTAAIFIAQHLAAGFSRLPEILSWRCGLPVSWCGDAAPVERGRIYAVPPGYQLEVRNGFMQLKRLAEGPLAWLGSPDALLRSLAQVYGARAAGVILSGNLPVGLSGLRAIHAAGGLTIAQHRQGAGSPAMPSAAADLAKAQMVLTLPNIARALNVQMSLWETEAMSVAARA